MKQIQSAIIMILTLLSFSAVAADELSLNGVWLMKGERACSNGLQLKTQNFADYKIIVQDTVASVVVNVNGSPIEISARADLLFQNDSVKIYKIIPNQNAHGVTSIEIMQDRKNLLALYSTEESLKDCKGKDMHIGLEQEGAESEKEAFEQPQYKMDADAYVKCAPTGSANEFLGGNIRPVGCTLKKTNK